MSAVVAAVLGEQTSIPHRLCQDAIKVSFRREEGARLEITCLTLYARIRINFATLLYLQRFVKHSIV